MDFKTDVLDFNGTVLVDFWAQWCGPCKMLSPIIDEIGKEVPGLKIVKVDVDSESELATQYNVSSIPTVIIFENGKIKDTIVGFHQKHEFYQTLGFSNKQ